MSEQMAQYAPFPALLAGIVMAARYKPGWELTLEDVERDHAGTHSGSAGGLTLVVLARTDDVTTPYPNDHRLTHPLCGKLTELGEPCRNPVTDGGDGCGRFHRGMGVVSHVQPSLLEPPTLEEAVAIADREMAIAAENAHFEWVKAAETWTRNQPVGARFLAEDVVLAITDLGFSTHNNKAIGFVMKTLARAGVIEATGEVRRARTSHGAMKPVWVRSGHE